MSGFSFGAEMVEGITFADAPGERYIPLGEAAHQLHWPATFISKRPAELTFARWLTDGVPLASTAELEKAGATAIRKGCVTVVRMGEFSFMLMEGKKRVEVSLASQTLRAWQGSRLVLETHISSGRNGSTPKGAFRAGPYKAPMHYSLKYDHAPMPWSVQIHGNIFIHGSASVPDYPASHGCIRVPINVGNPAKFFYQWVDLGTPVNVTE